MASGESLHGYCLGHSTNRPQKTKKIAQAPAAARVKTQRKFFFCNDGIALYLFLLPAVNDSLPASIGRYVSRDLQEFTLAIWTQIPPPPPPPPLCVSIPIVCFIYFIRLIQSAEFYFAILFYLCRQAVYL